jgi:hypothetical protein
MRNRLISTTLLLATALASSPLLFAQAPAPKPMDPAAAAAKAAQEAKDKASKAQPFDPHDFNGIWLYQGGAARGKGVLGSISNDRPPLTPWGQAKFDKVRTSFNGRQLLNAAGVAPEKEWNDPTLLCDPVGYPRIMWQPYGQLVRFVMAKDEIFQFFEWDHTWRDVWTDGRKLDTDPDPRYFGYAVAHWEGDTLVMDENGFNGRTWVDMYGSPSSDQMTLHETFKRVDHDDIEWHITLTDPKTYTKPWASDKIMLKLSPKSTRAEGDDLREDFCIWSDQNHFFTGVDATGDGDNITRGITK